jgi:multidrug efflux pump subunit AcrB
VAVFLPVGLMGGVIGQFFKPFGITVSAAVMVSLLVARTLSPLLAVRWLKSPSHSPHPSSDNFPNAMRPAAVPRWEIVMQSYRRLLRGALNHRRWVLSLAAFSLALGVGLIPLIPKGFIPHLNRGEFDISYIAPLTNPATTVSQPAILSPDGKVRPPNPQSEALAHSLQVAKQLEAWVQRSPDVQTVFTTVGSRQGELNQGNLYVKLKKQRTRSTAAVQDQFRQQMPQIPGVVTRVKDIPFIDTGDEQPVQITLFGNDLKALTRTAQAIKIRIQKLPGFVDVTATGDAPSQAIAQAANTKIERLGKRRVAYISANLSQNFAVGDATEQAVAIAQPLLPSGVSIDLGGDSARISEIFGSFGVTIALSVLCIVVVLFLLFGNWADPLVIAFSLPLSLAGAMLAILITGSEFGMISVIGIIFLLGLTNKNAILMVDYINQLRRGGMARTEAILTAAPIRLRPILMTTAATILGMLPIALGWGAGSELRAPMAIAIIGGLVASTVLSLLVVPVVYAALDDLPLFKRRFFK